MEISGNLKGLNVKGFLYFLFFVALGAGLYLYLHKAEYFKVKDQVTVSQASGMDMYGGVTPPPKYAVITGTITNISEKNFNDVVVVYQAGSDTVRATIGSLPKGQSAEFKTNSMRTRRTGMPDYDLIDITYTEE